MADEAISCVYMDPPIQSGDDMEWDVIATPLRGSR
jgi:hypothetical protein